MIVEDDVPDLDDNSLPPPVITPTRNLKLRSSLSATDETEEKKEDTDKEGNDNQIPEGFTVVEEVESDSDDVQEVQIHTTNSRSSTYSKLPIISWLIMRFAAFPRSENWSYVQKNGSVIRPLNYISLLRKNHIGLPEKVSI